MSQISGNSLSKSYGWGLTHGGDKEVGVVAGAMPEGMSTSSGMFSSLDMLSRRDGEPSRGEQMMLSKKRSDTGRLG